MSDYGLKIWTPAGYVSFDSRDMPSYVKVVSSGVVTVSGSSSSTVSIPEGYGYVYVNGPSGPYEYPFEATRTGFSGGLYYSFLLENNTPSSENFGYVCIRL